MPSELSMPALPHIPPPIFTATPEAIVNDARRLIENMRRAQDTVVRLVQPDAATFANVLQPLADAENAMHLESNLLVFYKDVSPDAEIRDASHEAQKLLDDFAVESAMREDLYRLVKAVLEKKEALEPEACQLLQRHYQSHVQHGLELPAGPQRNRFGEIQRRLNALKSDFQKNQAEDDSGAWFLPQELEGIPESVLSDLDKGAGENEGKLRMAFDYSLLFPTLKYAKHSETRKRYYVGFENNCKDNVPIFKEIVLLRDEAARLLGYPNHAAFRLQEKMAKNPANVNAFLGELRSKLTAGGLRELETLKRLKNADLEAGGGPVDNQFFLWDLEYYKERMLERQYSVDHEKIAEYFPLQTTVRSMFDIFEHLFGLAFVEIAGPARTALSVSRKGSDLVWHEDVQVFVVWDGEAHGGEMLGYLYLDLFARPNKYGGVANFNVKPGFAYGHEMREYPATALVCNFTKPTPKKPSLLSHDEVVLLFHELGHGIHDLVSKTAYWNFHGTNAAVDFAEAPSQMLENWCWTASTLKSLSRHYSTVSPEYFDLWQQQTKGESRPPEKMPDSTIESLIRTKHVNGALYNLRVLHISIFDMLVHGPDSHETLEKMNISAEYNKLRKELMHIDGPEVLGEGDEWGHGQANLGHLISEYDAGFYAYLYSQVFADDMFHSVFAIDPMNAKEGQRYRYMVLEKGGSQDEMKTLTEFLGREPSTKPFEKELGLI